MFIDVWTCLNMYELILSCLSLSISLGLLWFLRKKFKLYEPLIKRSMSIMRSVGVQKQQDTAKLEKMDSEIKEIGLEMVMKQYPELGLFIAYMKENHPDTFGNIIDDPAMMLTLYQRYAPFLGQILGLIKGKAGGQQQQYDI